MQAGILACDGAATGTFRCVSVLTGQGVVVGIALNPNEGYAPLSLIYFHYGFPVKLITFVLQD